MNSQRSENSERREKERWLVMICNVFSETHLNANLSLFSMSPLALGNKTFSFSPQLFRFVYLDFVINVDIVDNAEIAALMGTPCFQN